jgi:hypothetical protein
MRIGVLRVVTIDDDRHVGHDAGTVYGICGAAATAGLVREVKSFTGPQGWRQSEQQNHEREEQRNED